MGEQRGGMPDPGAAADLAEFVGLLGELRAWAGMPSYRVLAKRVGLRMRPPRVVSTTTVVDAFRVGRRRLDLDLVMAIVRALGVEEAKVDQWRASCVAVHWQAKNSSPERVQGGGSPAEGTAPAELSADLTDFTGRFADIAALTEALTAGDGGKGAVPVAVVVGPGGIGKTSLAVHVGHRLAERFPDGQLFVRLRGAGPAPVSPGEALAQLLRSLGVKGSDIAPDDDARAAQYRSILAGRRMLVVLDDAADSVQVRPLLPGSGHSAVLVTSRNRLANLDGCRRVDVGPLDMLEARLLFTRIIGANRHAAEKQAVGQVLEACDGWPLAIRIVAAKLHTDPGWTVQALANRLTAEQGRLDELAVGERAIRSSFALSYANLPTAVYEPSDPARLFRLLSLPTGADISLRACAALTGRSSEQVARAIQVLADTHLVQVPVPGRFQLHDLLRLFAAERAAGEGSPADRRRAVERLLTWYLQTAAAATDRLRTIPLRLDLPAIDPVCPPLDFADRAEALSWLDSERTNLVAATGQAAQLEMFELAWQLPVSLWAFFGLRKLWTDWLHTYRIGLDAAQRTGDLTGQSRILNGLGMAMHDLNRKEEALGYYQRAVEVRRASGDLLGQATALGNMGNVLQNLGRNSEAFDRYAQALAISRALGDHTTEANTLNNIAHAQLGLGQVDRAARSFEEAAEVYRIAGSAEGQAIALGNLGEALLAIGRQEEAKGFLTEALRLHREFHNVYCEATVLVNLGNALCYQGQTPEGLQYWQQAQIVLDRLDDPRASRLRSELGRLTPETRVIKDSDLR